MTKSLIRNGCTRTELNRGNNSQKKVSASMSASGARSVIPRTKWCWPGWAIAWNYGSKRAGAGRSGICAAALECSTVAARILSTKISAVTSLTARCCACSKEADLGEQSYFGVAGLAVGLVVEGAGAVSDGGTFVASAGGSATRFVLRIIAGALVLEGAAAGAVNGAVGIDPGSLSFFVNAVPADL